MADLSITAASVVKGANASVVAGTAGATITAGKTVYLDPSDSKYKLADANASATTAALAGVALNGASDGQPISVLTGGNLNPGATVTVGEIYVLSATAGGIAPEADLATGHYVAVLGVGTTTSNIAVQIQISGAVVP